MKKPFASASVFSVLAFAFLAGTTALAASPANAGGAVAGAGAAKAEALLSGGSPAQEASTDNTQTLALAEQVYTGRMGCELGKYVSVTPDPLRPGQFEVSGQDFKFQMTPVATSTGAVRLEDVSGGAVWLQIANKSMLMNQKAGKRLADECMSPAQMRVAQTNKISPPKSLLGD